MKTLVLLISVFFVTNSYGQKLPPKKIMPVDTSVRIPKHYNESPKPKKKEPFDYYVLVDTVKNTRDTVMVIKY